MMSERGEGRSGMFRNSRVHRGGGALVAAALALLLLAAGAQAREADPSIGPVSGDVALGVVGAILECVASRIEEGRVDELPDLTDSLSDFVLRNVLPTGT